MVGLLRRASGPGRERLRQAVGIDRSGLQLAFVGMSGARSIVRGPDMWRLQAQRNRYQQMMRRWRKAIGWRKLRPMLFVGAWTIPTITKMPHRIEGEKQHFNPLSWDQTFSKDPDGVPVWSRLERAAELRFLVLA